MGQEGPAVPWEPHGGEVDAFAERFGRPRDQWLDLSTGINPNPYPIPDLARDYWSRLPDSGLDAWIRDSAAACYGVADPAWVVAAPGTQALIQWLPRLIPTCAVAILGPTYREHAAAWRAAGHAVVAVESLAAVPASVQIVVVVNPNNPDGRLLDPDQLLRLARGRLLVVDEAFVDTVPEASLGARVGRPDLLILRSFGKFFGLAGLRLGFALVGPPLSDRLRRAFGPWAISGPAAAIGAVALADEPWQRATRVRLTAASGRLDGLLLRAGLAVVGGTSLFRLIETARAEALFAQLAEAGILVRRFAEQPTWLRFGLPEGDAGFDRLGTGLIPGRPHAAAPARRP